jgi:TRAP-type C4-dicarboxylate transport system substrate-binding protein
MKFQKAMTWILAGLCLSLSFPQPGEGKPIVLKFATLAPEGSAWMKTLRRVNRELESKTGGALKIRAYPGGVMGDDQTVLRKMRINQIHMAGITGLGLGSLCRDVQVLGAPFLFRNYEEVDYVLARVTEGLEGGFQEKGYVLLGWTEIGFIYMMSNKPLASLEALRGAKVWMPEGDLVSQAVLQKAGVSPVPLGISDVLLALQTGLVDVIYSPAVGAIALQWFTKVRYITLVPLSYGLGGIVMTQKAFKGIPEDHQRVLQEILQKNMASLTTRTRRDNEEALKVMAREGIEFVQPSPQEVAEFQQIAQEATAEMAGKVFSVEILQEINTYLNDARGGE